MKKDNNILIYEILTRREIQVTQLISQGHTNKEIAEILCISYNTVRTHHRNILKKTNNKTIGGLIRFAIENGLQ